MKLLNPCLFIFPMKKWIFFSFIKESIWNSASNNDMAENTKCKIMYKSYYNS